MKTKHIFLLLFATSNVVCQIQTSSIFAHNDYAQKNPFYGAYELRVGYIEADVFLKDDQLYVAHTQNEIKKERTLEALYLIPLKKEIQKNKEWAYPDSSRQLRLMIDLKTEGVSTLNKLVEQLKSFPGLLNAKGFEIFISGNVPSTDRWNEFPLFIHFDGRPGIQYTEDHLKRITLISTSFREYSRWNGKDEIPGSDKTKLVDLINTIHSMGKEIRFWSAPDFERGWQTLIELRVDVIGTDRVPELIQFIGKNSPERNK